MGIRTGAQVLEGLRDGRALYMDGERIADVTRDPRLAGPARSLAELYDLQHEQLDEMSYISPTTGDRVGLSFIEPKTREDLVRRRVMVKRWHDHSLGMFGRAPDFLNVVLSAWASGAQAFGQHGGNMRAYYEFVRENDLVATHSFTNPQVDRSKNVAAQAKDLAAKIVKETESGIVIRGARMLATFGAYSDELIVMPAPSFPLPENTDDALAYAIGFAVPMATEGLKFICRPTTMHLSGDPNDHPLASRFDESDCMVIFDDVKVPWERVFIHRDVGIFNSVYARTFAVLQGAHQFVTKDLAKSEFMMGLAFALVKTTNIDGFQHIQHGLAELINQTEMVRACLLAAEAQASLSPHGTMIPGAWPLEAIRFNYGQMFRRACEIIQIMGAGGLFMVPSCADLDGPLAEDVNRYYQAANADARSRIKLFRLAYDAALSSFSGRQQLYERYFAGDPVRAAAGYYHRYDTKPYADRIWQILDRFDKDGR